MKFTDLPIQAGADLTSDWVFAVATATETEQLSWEELQKSFTGLTARDVNGISIFGYTAGSGITVGDNGFLGVNNIDPDFSLHVGDNLNTSFPPQIRVAAGRSNRSAAISLADSGIFWKCTKKPADKDFYIEVSEDASDFTGVVNIDKNGNFGIFNGSADLDHKFYVSGGASKFESGNHEIIVDPSLNEVRCDGASTILKINNSNTKTTIIGNSNSVYVRSDGRVGIGTSILNNKFTVAGESMRLYNASSDVVYSVFSNTSNNSYINFSGNILNFGATSGVSANNLCYDASNKRLGIGIINPLNKLHVYTNDSNVPVKFETNYNARTNEVFQVSNYTGDGGTGPTHILHTFGRASGPTSDVKQWSIGLYDDGSTNTYEDVFAFRIDGSTSEGAIKAYIDRDGDLDIKGSYTSNTGNYCKGKFVQVYETRVTGNDIYFNPFYPSSSTNASGSNDSYSTFTSTPFAGTIEKVEIFSCDNQLSLVTSDPSRLEICVSNGGGAGGFISGFYDAGAPIPEGSLPSNGVIGYVNISSMTTPGVLYTFGKNVFSGSTSFSSNKFLQYRICGDLGNKDYPVDFTVVSTISYTVT